MKTLFLWLNSIILIKLFSLNVTKVWDDWSFLFSFFFGIFLNWLLLLSCRKQLWKCCGRRWSGLGWIGQTSSWWKHQDHSPHYWEYRIQGEYSFSINICKLHHFINPNIKNVIKSKWKIFSLSALCPRFLLVKKPFNL